MSASTDRGPHGLGYRVTFRNAISAHGIEHREYETFADAEHAARTVRPWNNTAATVRPIEPGPDVRVVDGLTIVGPERPFGTFTVTGERARGGTMTVLITAAAARLVGVRDDIPDGARDDQGAPIDRRLWAMGRASFTVAPLSTEPRTPVGAYSSRYVSSLPAAIDAAARFIR